MNVSTILYPIILVLCGFLIYTNFKNNRQYEKENIEILYFLNEDDKTMRLASRLLLAFMIFSSGVILFQMFKTKSFNGTDSMFMVVLPIMLIVLYVPLTKKTRVTTLGIYKRTTLIRWENIKSVNYLKPDAKGRVKVKVLHLNMNREINVDLLFKKDDDELAKFKYTVKEYRSNKKKSKKDKKSGN
ncbi:hypothetical protein [Sedimentibacter sp. MB31-C6]|uniref:hypothetical protein n=1 Tax=Sedimentibacter sp. MB31-C6 TaxID=3109366 RepID=UPI002DDD64D0|nr:hypothetical protein [Sedimentibacter sp. MB36-C1]WSI05083.1 hypothetical protein U8307_04640 [Sedimentibacter sp. MB36-C1]